MQTKCKIFGKSLTFFASLLTSLAVYAQSDPLLGQKAPAGTKADGKLTEWASLPLYNKSTQLHYTVANDANNIYLAFTCTDATSINKILGGGLTIAINKDGKKKEKDAAVVSYPLSGGGMRMLRGGNRQGGTNIDTAALVTSRKQIITGMKEVGITGIKDITDTLISIYNVYSLKAAMNVDSKANLIYELAIPLKLLELDASSATEIAFNVKVNGIQFNNNRMNINVDGGARSGSFDGGGMRMGGGFGGGQGMMELTTPSDFWSKYKLAKP